MSVNVARSGWYRWVFDHLDLPTSARVLDVGSGRGFFWRANADRLPRSWNVVCLDVVSGIVHQGDQLDDRPNTRWLTGDVHSLPFGEKAFDGIVALHVLAGTMLSASVDELRRVISGPGAVYATSSGSDHVRAIAESLATRFQDVRITPYADAVQKQELEPLADTLATSWSRWPGIDGATPEETRTRIAQVLEGMGTFDVHREDCLIVAKREVPALQG